jgi:CRISPR-associated protein Cas1
MTTLYLDRKGLALRLDGAALALYENSGRVRTVPLALLERVVIRAETALNSNVLGAIVEAGAAVVILSGRQGRRIAVVTGRPHNDARVRLAQYARSQEPDFRLKWAKRLVERKIASQMRFLGRALQQRPDVRKPVMNALETLRALHGRCGQAAPAVADTGELLGVEGAAQAAYFRAYTALFPASLEFTGRNRRPPRDPVNACLSLGYTLLHFEAVRVAHAAGFDPMIGLFHETAFGRESLACDLVEPLRPQLDAWVWELFRSRVLRVEHFREDKGTCLLDKAGRAHFYEHYERFLRPACRMLRRYCRVLARALLADVSEPPVADEEENRP